MKNVKSDAFYQFLSTLDEVGRMKIKDFFKDFQSHCLLVKKEKIRIEQDFKNAILYYISSGTSLDRALDLLDTKYLGGFYARPPILWFPLDDAAKIYPLSMGHGQMSVFRLSIYLKKPVIPELLQMALNFTIKRFPGFATTLKKGVFWHYLDTTKRRFCVEKEHDIPCQPLKIYLSGSQSFRVLYYNNRISAEFFHVLTDGTGGMTFLKVLAAEYLRLTGVTVKCDDTLWNISAAPDVREFENAFSRVPVPSDSSGFVDKPALQMNGRLSKVKPCRIIHFKMDAKSLKSAAEAYNTTITTYLLSLMFISGKSATDELQGETSIQVPVNMRKYYPSKTVRNFSMYCGIRMSLECITSVSDIIKSIENQLKEKSSKEKMSEMLSATEKLVTMMKYIPLMIKQPVAKLVYGFLGDKIFTNTLSNLGVVQMPPILTEHIDSMDFVLGTAITNRVNCAVVTFHNTTTFTITKMTADPSFEETFYKLLSEEGIPTIIEGSEIYEA